MLSSSSSGVIELVVVWFGLVLVSSSVFSSVSRCEWLCVLKLYRVV